jgi:4,5-dihydroxyphthalate decarboxylase
MAVTDSKPPMNLGVLRFDRTAGLIDGRVTVDNINVINVPGGKAGVAGFQNGSLDAADIPFARYVFWKSIGEPVTGIPVFTDRLFQHQYIYTRTDAGINDLGDLRGRRVMCAPSYFSTPSFWHRAMLKEDHRIAPHEIEWFSAFPESGGMRLPDGVRVTHAPASMLGLEKLLDGTVDCLMTARTAFIPDEHRDTVKRVIPDVMARQRDWAARAGFFPNLHVVAVHNMALEARPGLGDELCQAFDLAKDLAYRILQDERMTSLPFMRSYLDDTIATWGDDPWPYGLEKNRPVLDQFLQHAHEQGLTERRLSVDELFDNDASGHIFEARMMPGCITGFMDGGWAPEPTP